MKKLLLTLIFSFSTFLQAEGIPSFTLTTFDNRTITVNPLKISESRTDLEFKEFKGKAVLLSLFGYRCPPCIKEIPEFIELTKKHKDTLEIVALESQGYPADLLEDFVEDYEMNYNVIPGINHGDFIEYISTEAGYTRGTPLPLLLAINKNGEVIKVKAGYMNKKKLEELVEQLNK
ncbi:MAG: Putative lipoprotein thiredoxin [uncultured Sulfurovum sp.]|uniref:Lipoprotein thiredoxin n=1 Tax=uncultured Sulfurovum sp. TaxID=269237 RepID=A0A6S6UB23_9BACT|nr:MAG: Putative lipoprotein thiredoxin [uncultured Sulfurovum sp.]